MGMILLIGYEYELTFLFSSEIHTYTYVLYIFVYFKKLSEHEHYNQCAIISIFYMSICCLYIFAWLKNYMPFLLFNSHYSLNIFLSFNMISADTWYMIPD